MPRGSETSTRPIDVSVVVPTYNRARMLVCAIESCLAQSGIGVQVIVVDDASSDGTARLVEEYGHPVELIRLAHNSGPAAARRSDLPDIRLNGCDRLRSGRKHLERNASGDLPALTGSRIYYDRQG